MQEQVEALTGRCTDTSIISANKTQEPIMAHKVPLKCWESVAVDLFGSMPTQNHVIVVQDLASRYPAAKLVSSTSASKGLPALAEIYNTYENPISQLSDNGPRFNSDEMVKFANTRNISLQKIPPMHPVANPAETFMRPLGKTMKIAHSHSPKEAVAIQHLLGN